MSHANTWGSLDERHPDEFSANLRAFQSPLDEVYQKQRDFWAFGGSATLGVISVQAEVHPLQLVDLITSAVGVGSVVFYDVLADEY